MATFIPNVSDTFPEPALFRPDFSFLDKMLSRRQQMYERGFAEVAGKYAELNRPLTNSKNVVERNTFLKEAMTNLKDLASMDLSQHQNVTTASSVFQPFWKNTHILKDMMFTQNLDKEESIAESYRLRDGGKEFHPDNLKLIQRQRAAFANANPMDVDKFLMNQEKYTPYVDVDKEFAEYMKNFKPDDVQDMPTLKGFYKITKQDASARPEQIRRYLEGVMSEKVKNQLRIHAIAQLGDNPNFLINSYANTAQDNIKYLDGQIQKISGEIKIEKDPALSQQLKDLKTSFEDRKGTYEKELQRIKAGDIGFLSGKTDQIAYDMYFNAKMDEVSKAYSRRDYKIDITENSVAMNIWKENNADRRHRENLLDKEKDREHALRMKQLEGSGFFETPSGNIAVSLSKGDIKNNGIAALNAARSQAMNNQKAAVLDFTRFMLNFYKNDKVSDANDQLTERDLLNNPALVEKFVSKYANLAAVQEFKSAINLAQTDIMQANQMLDGAKSKVSLSSAEQSAIDGLKNNLIKKFGNNITVTSKDGRLVNISTSDVYEGILNKSITLETKGNLLDVNINGINYVLDKNSKNPIINTAVNIINSMQNDIKGNKNVTAIYDRYREAVNKELAGGADAMTTMVGIWADDSKTAKGYINTIQAALTGAIVEGKVDVTNVRTADQRNRVYFSISTSANAKMKFDNSTGMFGGEKDPEPITDEKILKRLQVSMSLTPGSKVGKDANGFYIDFGTDYSKNRMMSNMSLAERKMIELDNYASEYNSPFWYPMGEGNYKDGTPFPQFRYEKVKGYDGSPKYYLYDGSGGPMIGGKVYSNLADLMTDAKAYTYSPQALQIQKNR